MLDKITDDEFTKSRKGLLTLFCIGVCHVVLGVSLGDDVKIAVPWLPVVNFETPENTIYLFFALLLYTTYRYILYSVDILEENKAKAMAWGLKNSALGRFFVKRMITNEIYYVTQYFSKSETQLTTVSISTFQSEDPTESFHLTYDKASLVSVHSSIGHDGMAQKAITDESLKQSWGLCLDYPSSFGDDTYYRSSSIIFPVKAAFGFCNYYFLLLFLFKDSKTFDFMTPIFLNFFLVLYYTYS